jgi:hypothetical protein
MLSRSLRMGTYNGDGVLADILEPDELEVAATALAVDALADGLADDNVAQGATALHDEGRVLLACQIVSIETQW